MDFISISLLGICLCLSVVGVVVVIFLHRNKLGKCSETVEGEVVKSEGQ